MAAVTRICRLRSAAASAALLLLAASPIARANVAERVVAVVGEHAILLSDMHQRARPFLLQIHQKVPPGAQQAAATHSMP